MTDNVEELKQIIHELSGMIKLQEDIIKIKTETSSMLLSQIKELERVCDKYEKSLAKCVKELGLTMDLAEELADQLGINVSDKLPPLTPYIN